MAGKASRSRRLTRIAQGITLLVVLALAWLLLRPPAPPSRAPEPESVALPEEPEQTGSEQAGPEPQPPPPAPNRDFCQTELRTFRHGIRSWSRELELPAVGRFVEEAHYVTREDSFGPDDYPGDQDERIELHLRRALRMYRRFDPEITYEKLFPRWFSRVWTPSEGGNIGQGSVGPVQRQTLVPDEEMWLVTMQWLPGQRPPTGTRMLLRANGRKVVVVAGYETGPEQEKFLGGVTPEVHRWLGTHNGSRLEVFYLADQEFPAGPSHCEVVPPGTELGQR